MKGRMQKILEDTCSQNYRAELEGYVEGQILMCITEPNYTDKNQTENSRSNGMEDMKGR